MSSEFWFLDKDQNPHGPVSKDEIIKSINDGSINKESLIWTDGMSEWSMIGQVTDFSSYFKVPVPPPIPAPSKAKGNDDPSKKTNFWSKSKIRRQELFHPKLDTRANIFKWVFLVFNVLFLEFMSRAAIGVVVGTVVIIGVFVKEIYFTPANQQQENIITKPPNYSDNKLNIVFTHTVPSKFKNGHATQCILKINVHNNTKYHFDKITFQMGSWDFVLTDWSANTFLDDTDLSIVSLINENGQIDGTCFDQADYIRKTIEDVQVFNCIIPGLAEGDCQQMVSISTTLSLMGVTTTKLLEAVLGEKQTEQVRSAMTKAGLDNANFSPYDSQKSKSYIQLLDTIVTTDSASWSFNKYIVGSMRNVSLENQSKDGSQLTIKGTYDFVNGNQQSIGWVKVKFSKTDMPCLTYFDFENICRAIVFQDVSADE